MKLRAALIVFCLLAFTGFVTAQQAKPAPAQPPQMPGWLVTPEVQTDGSVTFRFLAPNAQEVKLAREGPSPWPCKKTTRASGR